MKKLNPKLAGIKMLSNEKNQYNWIDEYHNGARYGLAGKILIDEKSCFQRITIIESEKYGKSLLLDGCWMTTEYQEKSYHECLVHPALCSSSKIDKVLIIGGGDGGSARECLRYKEVQQLDMVEIDERVIKLSQKYLPSIGNNAWNDSRLNVKIEDGVKWVANSEDNYYDVIIVDSSDPKGPSEGLYNKTFFEQCRRILKPKGILGTQSESPEAFTNIHIDMIRIIREIFNFADPLYGYVPIYPSGSWSWTFASMGKAYYLKPLINRAKDIEKKSEIWSTRWQAGAFQTMPKFIERKLNK